MDWTCPTCSKTFKRTNQAHKCFTGASPELAFPGTKAKWLPLYHVLLECVKAQASFTCDYPPSGGALWRRRSIFASMHGETKGLYVNFHSDLRLAIEGLITVEPISAHRLLHIVCFDDPDRVPEIAGYIVASYLLTEQSGQTRIGGDPA